MAWIESHENLRSHVKTARLRRLLGITTAQTVGHLHMLWWWSIEHSKYGLFPPDYEAQDIADGCGWEGDPNTILNAFLVSGWLKRRDNGWIEVHGWLGRCGAMLKRRYRNELDKVESVAELEEYRTALVAESGPEQLALTDSHDGPLTARLPSACIGLASASQLPVVADPRARGGPTDRTDHTDRTYKEAGKPGSLCESDLTDWRAMLNETTDPTGVLVRAFRHYLPQFFEPPASVGEETARQRLGDLARRTSPVQVLAAIARAPAAPELASPFGWIYRAVDPKRWDRDRREGLALDRQTDAITGRDYRSVGEVIDGMKDRGEL